MIPTRTTLSAALRSAGFSAIAARGYGESDVPALRGLERHERRLHRHVVLDRRQS